MTGIKNDYNNCAEITHHLLIISLAHVLQRHQNCIDNQLKSPYSVFKLNIKHDQMIKEKVLFSIICTKLLYTEE